LPEQSDLNNFNVPVLNKRKIFNDPVHGFITIPHELIFDLIEHPWFQRLRRIKQLGLSDYVYPGALHTRFHHALGAFHLMQRALGMLRLKGVQISAEEELSAGLAILLHDIGHGPFSHTLEHSLIPGVHHEQISRLYMSRLNEQFGGRLTQAIAIFEGTYPRRFLHQLVSGQLDVDRLDYLTRDSFFTGVSEGVVSYDRIIEMMQVHDDQLVIEEKGIYSIEKFIISRRLMYWQVYLHKTVLCAEEMLIRAIRRARYLIARGLKLQAPPALSYFLEKEVSLDDFGKSDEALDQFSRLDDVDVFAALKFWREAGDPVLALLSSALLERRIFRIEMGREAIDFQRQKLLERSAIEHFGIGESDAGFLVFAGSTSNFAYNPHENMIRILNRSGQVTDITQASDQLNISVLSVPVVKYYLCYPKVLSAYLK